MPETDWTQDGRTFRQCAGCGWWFVLTHPASLFCKGCDREDVGKKK